MRSRVLILATLVGLAAVALVIGVAVAGAGQSDPLPGISAPDLLAKMAQADGVTAVSGEIAWQNGLFGDLSAASAMGHLPAQSPLTSSGSGRIWVSEAGAKVESQGSGGDQVVVVDKAARTAWVFDYAQNTVKRVVVTGEAPAETPSPAPDATLMTPEMIGLYLQQVARFATVEVAGQTKVAGRDSLPAAHDAGRHRHRARLRPGRGRRQDDAAAAARGVRQGCDRPGHQVRVHQRELRLHRPGDVRLHAAGGRQGDDQDHRRPGPQGQGREHAAVARREGRTDDGPERSGAAGRPGRSAHARPGRQAGPLRARVGA